MRRGLPRSADRSGFTLLEALVAGAVGVLLCGLVLLTLRPVMQSQARTGLQAELQQRGVLALNELVADLHASAAAGVTLIPGAVDEPLGAGILRVLDASPTGRRVWDEHVVIYAWLPEKRVLVRKRYPPGPPDGLALPLTASGPVPLDPDSLLHIATRDEGTATILARDVELFSITHAGGSTQPIVQPLTVRIVLQKEALGGPRRERFEQSRTAFLRNSS